MSGLDIQIIRSFQPFLLLKKKWLKFEESLEENNPFLSHEWLCSWWEVYGNGSLYIILCREKTKEDIVGALPLFLTEQKGWVRTKYLRFIGSTHGSADFLNCLASPRYGEEVYKACVRQILQDRSLWDVVAFCDMDRDSAFYSYLKESGIRLEFIQDPQKVCPYKELPEQWNELLKGLSRKARQKIGYYRRLAARKGPMFLERIDDTSFSGDVLKDMLALRRDRMEQKGLGSFGTDPAYQRFHQALMARFIDSGRLQLFFLSLAGKRVAYLYCFSGRRCVYFYQTGFDRSFRNLSVGFLLLGMVLEHFVDSGWERFEFLRGDESYKYQWEVTGERVLGDAYIFNSSFGAYILRTLFLLKSMLRKIKNFKTYKGSN